MPSVTFAQHFMWVSKMKNPHVSEKEKAVAKEFLDADKVLNKYQDGYPGIICAIIKKDNKFVILYHNKAQTLSFPTGKVNRDEKDEDAVIRECNEELGITVSNPTYKGWVSYRPKNKDHDLTFRVYFVDQFEGTVTNKEKELHREVTFKSKQELNAMIKLGTSGELIKLCKEKGWV